MKIASKMYYTTQNFVIAKSSRCSLS